MGEILPDVDFELLAIGANGSRMVLVDSESGVFAIYGVETRMKIFQMEDHSLQLLNFSSDMQSLLCSRGEDTPALVLHLIELGNGHLFLQYTSHLEMGPVNIAVFRNIKDQLHLQTVEGEGNGELKVYQLSAPKKAKAKSKCVLM